MPIEKDENHGYRKAVLKIRTDRVLEVSGVTTEGESVVLAVEVSDYAAPDKKTGNLTVRVPLREFMGNNMEAALKRLDVILEQEARKLAAAERVKGLVAHQFRFQTNE